MHKRLRKAVDAGFRLLGMYRWEALNPGMPHVAEIALKQWWYHSREGTFRRYFSANGETYRLVIEIGPFAVTWDNRDD